MAIGAIHVSGAVVNVLATGSLLECKRFAALAAAQASLQRLRSAARAAVRIRRLSIAVKASGETCGLRSAAGRFPLRQVWLEPYRNGCVHVGMRRRDEQTHSERREKAMGTVEEDMEGYCGKL